MREADDPEMTVTVLALLREDAAGDSLLDREDLSGLAGEVLGGTPVPRTIGLYRVLGVLGQGGMGDVYLARREDLEQRVAIKLLRDAALSPARRERFQGEQRTLARLDHPSIARLFYTDVLPDGTPYFVMEHVEGTPIHEHCAARRSSLGEILTLFREVCEAVLFAHRKAVIHRDLKPSNILVTEEGRVKLLDFGIARKIADLESEADDAQEPTPARRRRFRPMTPAYAAPEQIRGEEVGVQADVFALGVVLYELLTGTLPFGKEGVGAAPGGTASPEPPSAIAKRHQEGNSPGTATSDIRAFEWADLDALCLKALQKNPAERYPSVEALLRDLAHFRTGEPLEARGDDRVYRLAKFSRRHRREIAGAGLMAAVLAGVVLVYTTRISAARDEAIAAAARAERIQDFMENIFEGGAGAVGPADSLRVTALLERGVREAAALDGEPVVQAELFETLGKLYQRLGDFDRADSLLQWSHRQHRALPEPNHAGLARTSVALGLLREDQARLDDAERRVGEGLAIARENLPPDHPVITDAVTALGEVLQARGEYEEAIDLLETAVRLRAAQDPESLEFLHTLTELANTHFYDGNYAASDSLNRIVIDLTEERFGSDHPFVANSLINLGASRVALEYYEEAERHYRRALVINRAYYGEESDETASTLMMLGQTLASQRRLEEAREVLEPALEIRRRIYGEDHPRVANVLNELGAVALYQEDLDAARRYYGRMVEIYRATYDEPHFFTGIALSNLAGVHREAGENEAAETAMREALEIFTETQGPDHVNTGIGHLKLGRILLRDGRPAEAEEHLLIGHEIVSGQANPAGEWLQEAREDLVAVYEALGEPEKAARYRVALEESLAEAESPVP